MKKVLCVGHIVLDIPIRPVPRDLFNRGGSMIDMPVWSPGGDATNVSVALAKLGIHSSLCALVGSDPYGDYLIKTLEERGVNSSGISRHPDNGTAVVYVLIEENGERHFVTNSNNISADLSDRYVPDALLDEADVVYLGSAMGLEGMDTGGTARIFKRAHEGGKITMSDFVNGANRTSDEWLKLLEPMLTETDIILPSYVEAVRVTGCKELPDIRKRFSQFGIKLLIVKLGAEGCYLTDFKDEWKIPAFEEFKPLDTTGAGDSFAGGFIRGTLEGWDPRTAATFATAVAGYNITKVGATGGVPDFQTAYQYVTEHAGGTARFPLNALK